MPGNFNMSMIGRLGTGLPYTPSFQNLQIAVENSDRKPTFFDVDLYSSKTIHFGGLEFILFLRVYNLFDRKNEKEVFTDTGRAGYTLAPLYTGGLRPRGLNSLDAYYIRPDYYSAPREINIGFTFRF